MPRCSSRTVTFAPCTTAPFGSRTMPCNCAVEASCAGSTHASISSTQKTAVIRNVIFISLQPSWRRKAPASHTNGGKVGTFVYQVLLRWQQQKQEELP